MGTKIAELEKMARGEGCLGKAAQDEPLFILRAQDIVAPAIVRAWAHLVEEEARRISDEDRRGHHFQKVEEARALADRMEAWQESHFAKLPD